MNTITRHAKVLGLVLSAVLLAPLLRAQSPAIAIDRTQYFVQKGAPSGGSVVTPQANPLALNINIRGGLTDMSQWGPAFYKPGSGGVPQSGASSSTNTGTLNFSPTPNNGGDYMFIHDFASIADLEAFYPNGDYGILFQGSGAPTPSSFGAGLQFTNSAYPGATPQIATADNGADWRPDNLVLAPTGVTTFSLNSFTDYDAATYGAIMGVGVYQSATGNVVGAASLEAYNLPLGDSSATPTPHYDAPLTEFSIDSSWLVPGVPYTIEIHYTLLAGRPEEANLNGQEFQGVASSRKITTISVMVEGSRRSDFNGDGYVDILWENAATGERAIWLMNGTSLSSVVSLGTFDTSWRAAAVEDFDDDDRPDILWENTATGERAVWIMNGTALSSVVMLSTRDPAWRIVAAADFNADGRSDILWENTASGERTIWLMNGTTFSSEVSLGVFTNAWRAAGAGDFTGDGKPDIFWENTDTGERAIWVMDGTAYSSAIILGTHSTDWVASATNDFNADGETDILWENTVTGQRAYWLMTGTTMNSVQMIGTFPTEWRAVD